MAMLGPEKLDELGTLTKDQRAEVAALVDAEVSRQVSALRADLEKTLTELRDRTPEDRAALVVRQLFDDAMFSGWGVRTMSVNDGAYNPVMYHNGTVWPHDNSLICAGLARYGYRREANRIATAMIEAAGYSQYRLPEVFAGYARGESGFPVRYPTASSPQAWATAAPFLWLRLILGAEPRDGALQVDPLVPEQVGRLDVRGLHAFGRRWDVLAEGTDGWVKQGSVAGDQPASAGVNPPSTPG